MGAQAATVALFAACAAAAFYVSARSKRRRTRTPAPASVSGVHLGTETHALPGKMPAVPVLAEYPSLALTPATIDLISETVPVVGSTEAARIFYGQLFTLNPGLQPLFGDRGSQERKLMGMLHWVAASVADSPSLSEGLKKLGERHVNYKAKLAHFHDIKASFLQMITIVDQQAYVERSEAEADSLQAEGNEHLAEAELPREKPQDRHERLLDVSRAWEALLYVFIGEMGPTMLMQEDIAGFHMALANDLAAPAGGTCVALAGAQGAALLAMAASLTRTPLPGTPERRLVDQAGALLHRVRAALEELAGLDMSAYCRVMAAIRQPPLGQADARKKAISFSIEQAALVPLQMAEWAVYGLKVGRSLLPIASQSGVGDAGAGMQLLVAACRTALQNVSINSRSKLASFHHRKWIQEVNSRAAHLGTELHALERELSDEVQHRNVRDS